MVINVTQEHIDRGKRGACRACPVSLAILDTVSNARIAAVDHYDIRIWCSDGSYFISTTPFYVGRFVFLFDAGFRQSPFTFDIPVSPFNIPVDLSDKSGLEAAL